MEHPVNFDGHFEEGEKRNCLCGGGWTKHCTHKDCRWLRCPKCSAIYDVKGRRFWCRAV